MSKIISLRNKIDPRLLVESLKAGSVLLGPSDTVPGLLAPFTLEGRQKLDAIKGRSQKPYIVIARDTDTALSLMHPTEDIKKLAYEVWPGPVTIIAPAHSSLSSELISKDKTIAVRVPDDEFLQSLLANIPTLFSTSANITGNPLPHTIQAVDDQIKEACIYIVEDDIPQSTVASTIIDYTQEKPVIIRKGAVVPDLDKLL